MFFVFSSPLPLPPRPSPSSSFPPPLVLPSPLLVLIQERGLEEAQQRIKQLERDLEQAKTDVARLTVCDTHAERIVALASSLATNTKQ